MKSLFHSLIILAAFIPTTVNSASTIKKLTEQDYRQLELFGKVLEKQQGFRPLSDAEAAHVKGKNPMMIVAFAAGAGAAGVDAIWQYTATGQVNYWEVGATFSSTFFGTLTGGAAIPALGEAGAAALSGGVGVVTYNLTNQLQTNGMAVADAMARTALGTACNGCHDY
ncbi:hypothetical protein WKW50_23675 [Ochrobactrum sp. GPK 3]|uniref:hypothetical protein n=1 Tax=Brucella sp. 22210 TaxID=3453892 RepID=UPI0031386042